LIKSNIGVIGVKDYDSRQRLIDVEKTLGLLSFLTKMKEIKNFNSTPKHPPSSKLSLKVLGL